MTEVKLVFVLYPCVGKDVYKNGDLDLGILIFILIIS